MEDIQEIGCDFGRGYVKAYSEVDNTVKGTIFKSVIGDGRDMDLSEYLKLDEKPRYIEFENERYFVGLLAEKESQTQIRNSRDSKVSHTVRVLLASVLSEIAVKNKVNLMIGVPYKNYRKSVLKEVIETYKGKVFKVKDKITGSYKEICIENISIFREGDAALFHALKGKVNKERAVGLVSVGFRTTEMSYFDKGFIFNDKKSTTIEFGNKTMLSRIHDDLLSDEIIKDVNEIDSSNDYDDMKKSVYKFGSENLAQRVEDLWINKKEMDLYVAGGTALNLEFDDEFKVLEDAQMATAKGLFELAKIKL